MHQFSIHTNAFPLTKHSKIACNLVLHCGNRYHVGIASPRARMCDAQSIKISQAVTNNSYVVVTEFVWILGNRCWVRGEKRSLR